MMRIKCIICGSGPVCSLMYIFSYLFFSPEGFVAAPLFEVSMVTSWPLHHRLVIVNNDVIIMNNENILVSL